MSDYNFDPLGFADKLPFMLPWFREAELKHGRVAMLAFVGLIAPEIGTLPGLPAKCASAGIGGELRIVEAHDLCVADPLPFINLSPMFIIFSGAALIEVVTTIQKVVLGWGLTIENAGEYPGRKEIGAYLKQLPKNESAMVFLKLSELKHCRLAMIAFGGAWTQACLTAHSFPWIW
jgi:light-harvesting complex I chlorophyll a/b binding protein 1